MSKTMRKMKFKVELDERGGPVLVVWPAEYKTADISSESFLFADRPISWSISSEALRELHREIGDIIDNMSDVWPRLWK